MLRLARVAYEVIVAHCLDGVPDEACGLLAADPGTGRVAQAYPTPNAARSAKLYAIDGRDYLAAERDADGRGLELCGAFHSHTHTEAYPSPTDVERAVSPTWHYVIVSLRDVAPSLRSFLIDGNSVTEESVSLEDG